MKTTYGMTPDSFRAYNAWHGLATIGLAASLVVLPWLFNIGPNSWSGCAGQNSAMIVKLPTPAPVAVVAPPVIEPPAVLSATPPSDEAAVEPSISMPLAPTSPESKTAALAKTDAPADMSSAGITMPAAAPEASPAPAPSPEAVAPQIPSAKIYFESNKSVLPSDAKSSLASVIAYLKSNSNAKVSLSGFHDASGNQAHNDALAHDRAKSVSSVLQSGGVSPKRIIMAKPQVTTGKGSKDEARRVEVTIKP